MIYSIVVIAGLVAGISEPFPTIGACIAASQTNTKAHCVVSDTRPVMLSCFEEKQDTMGIRPCRR